MKTFLQRSILAIAMLLATFVGYAYDFEVDSIYYNKISDTEVEVTHGDTDYSYSGHVTIPDNINFSGLTFKVTKIGWRAFYGCLWLYSVEIPNSVTRIEKSAFQDCQNLESIKISKYVIWIGEGAFAGCSKVPEILIDEENSSYCAIDKVLYTKDLKRICWVPKDRSGTFIIPESVTWIEGYAFYGCTSLTSIKIPNSVLYIGECAFYSCASLTTIEIPSSVELIENAAFCWCWSLSSILIPKSVRSIGLNSFERCVNLACIFVDEDNDFYSSVDGVLYNKNHTKLIKYPQAKRAEKYYVLDSVTSVGERAFTDNTHLTSLVLGENVNSVGYAALLRCDSLKEITVLNPIPPEAYSLCGPDVYLSTTLYVPKESLDDYKNANGWKEFKNIVPIETSGIADWFVDSDVKIESGDGTITVSGAEGGICRIFDLRGIEVDGRAGISDYESFFVKSPELYIVQVTTNDGKNTIRKVMVK